MYVYTFAQSKLELLIRENFEIRIDNSTKTYFLSYKKVLLRIGLESEFEIFLSHVTEKRVFELKSLLNEKSFYNFIGRNKTLLGPKTYLDIYNFNSVVLTLGLLDFLDFKELLLKFENPNFIEIAYNSLLLDKLSILKSILSFEIDLFEIGYHEERYLVILDGKFLAFIDKNYLVITRDTELGKELYRKYSLINF